MKLSVITINFNNRDGLRKTIESVVNQTFKDFSTLSLMVAQQIEVSM